VTVSRRFSAVGGGHLFGVALGKEARVSAAVVADHDGSSAKVDDLDLVRGAKFLFCVAVVAPMNRLNGARGDRIMRVLLRGVEHSAGLSGVVHLHPRIAVRGCG
jgi:hypothetical protein